MVKSLVQIVTQLWEWATYASFKAWLLAGEDWMSSHNHIMPDNLGAATACTVACMTINPDIYLALETCSAMGTI